MPVSKSSRLHLLVLAVICLLSISMDPRSVAGQENDDWVAGHSRALIFGKPNQVRIALSRFKERAKLDVVPTMILALRYNSASNASIISQGLQDLTGHQASGWFEWMVWQENHPEIEPHESYAAIKLEIFNQIDPNFMRFFADAETLNGMHIRLEEITWGGVRVDGIPSLDHPNMIDPDDADYLLETDLVFGVRINGDARAYPLRIMGWHEMFNDEIGGVPVALAYCTLCGSGILFETGGEDRQSPHVFGSSGLLYRSNKLMFDRATLSLWNQFTGRPVVGPLADSGIELKIRPVTITSWASWRQKNPDTRVLSIDTGYLRDYGSGVVYREYFASPDLMFPTAVDETLLKQKDYVFGIRDVGHSKAWPMDAFKGGAVINDSIGQREIVLIGDATTRTVRAYERAGRMFKAGSDPTRLRASDGQWLIDEEALMGPDGQKLPRVPGHVSYWFAWNGYFGGQSDVYQGTNRMPPKTSGNVDN